MFQFIRLSPPNFHLISKNLLNSLLSKNFGLLPFLSYVYLSTYYKGLTLFGVNLILFTPYKRLINLQKLNEKNKELFYKGLIKNKVKFKITYFIDYDYSERCNLINRSDLFEINSVNFIHVDNTCLYPSIK